MIWEKETFIKYAFPAGIIAGTGLSNVYDRFIHGGVVDYLFWHYGVEFAVFNFEDVMIEFWCCGDFISLMEELSFSSAFGGKWQVNGEATFFTCKKFIV